MAITGVWVELTTGNIKNDHIYLRDVLSFFPDDAVGGSNTATASSATITVEFRPGSRIETDIDGNPSHLFIRNRSAVRDFFEKTGAAAGDRVLIEKMGPRHFRFEIRR